MQADIAEKVGLSQSTVCRDIQALQRGWLKDAAGDFDAAKAQELAKIDDLERTYRTAWIRSCEDAETQVAKAVKSSKESRKEATKTTKGQSGDPRFLIGVQWCIDRRCKILGIDAPQEIDLTTKGDKIVVLGVDLGKL